MNPEPQVQILHLPLMPKNSKHRFTLREHRAAMHVKAAMKKAGKDDDEAEEIGWKTVAKRHKYGIGALRSKKRR